MDGGRMQVFAYDEAMVRTVDVDGEPWFVANDVANILDYRNAPDMTRNLDEDEVGTTQIVRSTYGGNPNISIISESGLYHVIFQSRKPEAQRFRKWVTSEVLPSIRRTGGYGAAGGADIGAFLETQRAFMESQGAFVEGQMKFMNGQLEFMQKQISIMEELRNFVMGRPESGKPALPPVSRAAPPKESAAIRRRRQVGDVAKFVDRFCDVTGDGGEWCKLKELYMTYKRWSPVRPMSRGEFEVALCTLYSFVRISARSTRGRDVRSVQGIALKDDWVERLVRGM